MLRCIGMYIIGPVKLVLGDIAESGFRYLLGYLAKIRPGDEFFKEGPSSMKISARNVFDGTIASITHGAVHAEVAITTDMGDTLTAIVTEGSIGSLGLAQGKAVKALVKAPWVILLAGVPTLKFSARNQLTGTVSQITKGAVNSEVTLTLAGGTEIHSIITQEAVLDLGLKVGDQATALIKASHIILAVE